MVDENHSEMIACVGVSVVIPCYNYARFLAQAVESVINQDYPLFEVILIDDGSTDETPEIAASYTNSIRYIRQENQGLSATRNNGIEHSKFDYVAFLDADDEWECNFLSVMIEKFMGLPEEYGVVACLDKKIDAQGKLIEDRKHNPLLGDITTNDLIIKNRFFPGGAIIKKHVFNKVGNFDTSLRSSEDRDMWIRISTHFKVWLIENQLIRIRKHGDNMSANPVRMRDNKLAVIHKVVESGIAKPNSSIIKKSKSVIHYQVAWIFYNQKKKNESLYSILRSILHYPLPMNGYLFDVPILFRLRAFIRFLFM